MGAVAKVNDRHRFISFYFVLFRFISFYFVLFRFIPFYSVLGHWGPLAHRFKTFYGYITFYLVLPKHIHTYVDTLCDEKFINLENHIYVGRYHDAVETK